MILADFGCSFSGWLSYDYTVVQRPTLLLRGYIPLLLCCALDSVELTDDTLPLYLPYSKERVRSGLIRPLITRFLGISRKRVLAAHLAIGKAKVLPL